MRRERRQRSGAGAGAAGNHERNGACDGGDASQKKNCRHAVHQSSARDAICRVSVISTPGR